MHGAKIVRTGFVEDGHQVDHGITAGDEFAQHLGIVDIGIDDLHRGQYQQFAMPFPMAGSYAYPMTGCRQ